MTNDERVWFGVLCIIVGLFALGIGFAHASPSPAQLGLDKSATTGNLSVMDISGAWVELGVVNGSTHTFQIPTSSLSVQTVTVGGVTCTLGGSCSPATTINSTSCTLGSSCSLPAPIITVNSQPTSGGAAGQLMFDTGSVLNESPLLVFTTPVLKILSNTAELSMGTSGDTNLFRDGAGLIAQRNGANAQSFGVYNGFSSQTVSVRGVFDWQKTSNVLTMGTEQGSGGSPTLGQFQFVANGTPVADFGVTSTGLWTFDDNINALAISATGNIAGAVLSSTGQMNSTGLVTSSVGFFGGNQTLTTAAPTVSAGQIGYGSTTTTTASCGSLAGAAGCITVNIAGTVRHVPFY